MKVRSYVNFALIKYWGKKDEALKLPNQSSLSFTINNLYTDVRVKRNSKMMEDQIYINGVLNPKEANRVIKHLDYIRREYNINDRFIIDSKNSVPMAAGLASSASSFSAITYAVLKTINKDVTKEEISRVSRIGSGSASRSIYDGFVVWNTGNDKTSVAEKLDIEWKDFRIIVCMIDKGEKKVSSNLAMSRSVLLPEYSDFVKQSRIDLDEMIESLKLKDLDSVGKIAVRNSNMMHDLIEKSGVTYRTKESYELIDRINNMNNKGIKAYYTMDAGPNVKIITTKEYVDEIVSNLGDIETLVCSGGEETKEILGE